MHQGTRCVPQEERRLSDGRKTIMKTRTLAAIVCTMNLCATGFAPAATGNVYGLFVGIDYRPRDGLLALRGDRGAEALYNAFSDNVQNFNGILLTGTEITRDQMWQSVGPFYRMIQDDGSYRSTTSDDILVVYMHGHGTFGWAPGDDGEETTDRMYDEAISLSNDGSSYWYDDDMFTLLNEFGGTPRGTSTWVILDSCFAGGFWGNNNPDDVGDLEKLTGIHGGPQGFVGLLAAAPEGTLAKPEDGHTYYDKTLYGIMT